LERSSSLEIPIQAHKIGRKKRTRNAMIFPPRVTVTPGRTKSTAIKLTLKRMSRSRIGTGAITERFSLEPSKKCAVPALQGLASNKTS
jgi:hypothetical protein